MDRKTAYLVAWGVALLAFIIMTAFASAYDTFPGDLWLTRRLQDLDSSAVADPLRWANSMVEWPYWGIPALAGSLYALWVAGLRIAPVIVFGFLARFLNNPLKDLTGRPRPSPDDVDVERLLSTLSFPSGHAYNAVILYGLIFFVVTLYARRTWTWVRLPVQVLCVLIIAGSGADRVFEGYHWPSDVVGGYLCGALVVGLLAPLGLWLTGRLRQSPTGPGR